MQKIFVVSPLILLILSRSIHQNQFFFPPMKNDLPTLFSYQPLMFPYVGICFVIGHGHPDYCPVFPASYTVNESDKIGNCFYLEPLTRDPLLLPSRLFSKLASVGCLWFIGPVVRAQVRIQHPPLLAVPRDGLWGGTTLTLWSVPETTSLCPLLHIN